MPNAIGRYVLALLALVPAVALREALDPVMGDTLPLVTLFGAVAAAVWLAGWPMAVIVALLGYLACAYLYIEPRGNIDLVTTVNRIGFVAYGFTCALIIGFGQAMRAARRRASEQREVLRVTLQSIGDGVVTTDDDGCTTYLNPVAESLTGWTNTDAHGQPVGSVFRIVNEKTRHAVESPAQRALREGVVVGLANHTLLIAKDGTERPIDDSAAPIRNDIGEVSGCVLIFRDATAQRRVERDRIEQLMTARVLASIVESSNDAIVGKALDGTIQTWNVAAEELFGYSAAEAVGKHISLVIPPDRIAEEDTIIARIRAGQRVEHFETERVCADGQRVQVSLTISPIRNEAGDVIGASKIARDITRQRELEAERQKFVTLVENSTDSIGMSDLEGVPFYANRAALEMVGLDSIEALKQTRAEDVFLPEDREFLDKKFLPEVVARGNAETEIRFRHFKTGDTVWASYKAFIVKDDEGTPIAFATVSHDITERRRLEDDLRKVAADLSEADRRKDAFLATLAHELRGPLAPLSNLLQMLKRADHDPALVAQTAAKMERQLGQLVRLVDDLLDVNRITYNRLELRRDRVELSDVIQQAIETARPIVDAAKHTLEVSLPEEACYVNGDPVRLTQAFANLINNAAKYTNERGTISVGATHDRHQVVVTVKDTGIGIAPDRLERIFDMFAQVETTLERSQGGLGIGLTLVKQLVQMHDGTVEARSDGKGRGSEFIVRLPVVEAGAVVNAPRATATAAATRKQTILVVDDNSDSAQSLAMLLDTLGHRTSTAYDGNEAVAAIERQRPDVVLLDIGLPGLSGYEVCKRIRAQAWGKETTLIALTGWGQADDRRQTREAGFNGHLVKPVDVEQLMELLNRRV